MWKILVVDDDTQFRRVLRVALSARGHDVSDAGSCENALEMIKVAAPDIVLLDLNMPVVNGVQGCRLMRASVNLPIIILSVSDSLHDRCAALRAGADNYLTKPFALEQLLFYMGVATCRRSPQKAIS